jgi:hypothetical protein
MDVILSEESLQWKTFNYNIKIEVKIHNQNKNWQSNNTTS